AIEALHRKDFDTVADLLLIYYDKAYLKGLSFRDKNKVLELSVERDDPGIIAQDVLKFYQKQEVLTARN
ncbi:MAG: hypothetical protein K8R74_13480, partial [Bacteroidales bacterium]|nr:hypothetical protein [Bacteroidales bacterium]